MNSIRCGLPGEVRRLSEYGFHPNAPGRPRNPPRAVASAEGDGDSHTESVWHGERTCTGASDHSSQVRLLRGEEMTA
jgi:hypothetical protein